MNSPSAAEIIAEQPVEVYHDQVLLDDGLRTTVHWAQYRRDSYSLDIQIYDKPTYLLQWCAQEGVDEAITGGFFLRTTSQLLGEAWAQGVPKAHVPFGRGWGRKRGSLYISDEGIQIAARDVLPILPAGDLLQSGPLLINHSLPTVASRNDDPEGFYETAEQHDEPLDGQRHPRAAIGVNNYYIWTVTADGRSDGDAGLYLHELAAFMSGIGASEALNLDGGRSATHISGGRLINHPRSSTEESVGGYPILSAVTIRPHN